MPDLGEVAVLAAIILIIFGAGHLVAGAGRRRRGDAWTEVARRLGVELRRGAGDRELSFELCADDQRLDAEHLVSRTRVRAGYLVGAGPVFEVVGGAGADRLDPWLSGRARNLVRRLTFGSISSGGRMVYFESRAELSAHDLQLAVDAVLEVARTGAEALEAMRRLPGARYLPPVGPWDGRSVPRVQLAAGRMADVTLEPAIHQDRAVSSATATGVAVAPFVWEAGGEPPQVVIAAGVAARLAAAAAVRLDCDGDVVRLLWPELVTDEERLLAGAEVVAALAAAPAMGAYR